MIFKHRPRGNQNHKGANWIIYTFVAEAEIDDEGIERDSEEIDDEKFSDTKDLDRVLEVSWFFLFPPIDWWCLWVAGRI